MTEARELCARIRRELADVDERIKGEVIDAGLAQGVEPARIAQAARLLQAYELLYRDSLPR